MPEPAPAPSGTPTVAPAKVSGELSPVTPTADRTADRTLSPVTRRAPGPDGLVAPDFPEVEKPALLNAPLQSMLSFKSREALPSDTDRLAPVGEGIHAAEPGSSAFFRSQAARLQDEKEHPWGTAENHPGLMGKVGHVLSKIGNIAGDVVAPSTMAIIPGTELNRTFRATNALGAAGEAQERETKEAIEQERMKHDIAVEDANVRKMDQIDKRLDETERSHMSNEERDLRKIGMTRDSAGQIRPLQDSEMSQKEHDLHAAQLSKQSLDQAKEELYKFRADPNSVQWQIAKKRVAILARQAETAAGRLDLQKDIYKADYEGTDEQGNPLAGVQFDADGHPIGVKVGKGNKTRDAAFQKNYIDNSEKIETAYQMYQHAMEAYRRGDRQTGASTMLALSQHIGTTFGQVKNSRQTRDLIEQHKNAIGLVDRLERFGNSLVTGDELSESQMKEFGDQIAAFRKLQWEQATKEAKRQNENIDFLPPDLEGLEQSVPAPKNSAARRKEDKAAAAAITAPEGKTLVYDPKGDAHAVKTEKLQKFLADPAYAGWSTTAPKK